MTVPSSTCSKGLASWTRTQSPRRPTEDYRDKKVASGVLAKQLRQAYRGLFLADENAHELSAEDLKGKFATLTGKDESVVKKMASTFKALAGVADFKQVAAPATTGPAEEPVESPALEQVTPRPSALAFAHTIYINLPATRDVAVYDAIFKSIREHLL